MNTRNHIYTENNNNINCEINHPDYGWIPFTASPNDVEKFGRDVYRSIKDLEKSGKITINPYVPPLPPSDEELERLIREERNYRLSQSDWSQLPDVSEELSKVWRPYRKALREVTLQAGFPKMVIWPTPPM